MPIEYRPNSSRYQLLRISLARTRRFIFLRLVIEHRPIKDEVILVALSEEQVLEQAPQISIIWPVFEAPAAAIVEVGYEVIGEALAQDFNWSAHLLFA